jgi:glyoxylase-like metal-dependent hydrolase (beta-lactamase superfamily II)
VADGETVGSFTAYHTPGHTPGHVAYVSEELDVALLGDLVRERRGALVHSPWLMSYDAEAVRRSVRRLVERGPAFSAACLGHGHPLREGGSAALSRLR